MSREALESHGSRSAYEAGCRCDECRSAASAAGLARREAARGKTPSDKHGTTTGYNYYGCRCDECRSAKREQARLWARRNPEKVADGNRRARTADPNRPKELWSRWYSANREYRSDYLRLRRERLQAESLDDLRVFGSPWDAHEDELLVRIESDIAAACALGRTYASVRGRRERLRKKGLLP